MTADVVRRSERLAGPPHVLILFDHVSPAWPDFYRFSISLPKTMIASGNKGLVNGGIDGALTSQCGP